MPDPIWLDSNTMIRLSKGDKALEAELVQMRGEGRQLLIPPKVNDEILNGNVLTAKKGKTNMPSPVDRGNIEALKGRLKIKVDMEGKTVGQKQRINTAVKAGGNLSKSDALVLSQVKASAQARGVQKPELFTTDAGFADQAPKSAWYHAERAEGNRPRPGAYRGGPSPGVEVPTAKFNIKFAVGGTLAILGVTLLATYLMQKNMRETQPGALGCQLEEIELRDRKI